MVLVEPEWFLETIVMRLTDLSPWDSRKRYFPNKYFLVTALNARILFICQKTRPSSQPWTVSLDHRIHSGITTKLTTIYRFRKHFNYAWISQFSHKHPNIIINNGHWWLEYNQEIFFCYYHIDVVGVFLSIFE